MTDGRLGMAMAAVPCGTVIGLLVGAGCDALCTTSENPLAFDGTSWVIDSTVEAADEDLLGGIVTRGDDEVTIEYVDNNGTGWKITYNIREVTNE